MATTYQSAVFAANTPAGTGHGDFCTSTHLHAVSGQISTWATGDVINFGWLPRGAVVVGAILKAASQLDAGASPSLTLSLGVPGAPALFKSAISTVGRAAGASADVSLAAGGVLWKNQASQKQAVQVTVAAGAATGASGTLEVDIEYYVEDPVGSAP